jgi:hypothetical protein
MIIDVNPGNWKQLTGLELFVAGEPHLHQTLHLSKWREKPISTKRSYADQTPEGMCECSLRRVT